MPHKFLQEVVDTLRQKAAAWHAAQNLEEKTSVESQIGEVVFRAIFAEDTTILGPWQLRTKGKRKEAKYEAFKARWEALCSADDCGINSRTLLAWCRSVALQKLMIDKGLKPEQLDWTRLCEIQRLKSVNRMIAEATMGIPNPSTGQAELHHAQVDPRGVDSREIPAPRAALATAVEGITAGPRLAQVRTDQAPATLAEWEMILGEPAQLLTNPVYKKLIADPAHFKDLSPSQREQLRSRVEKIAREMEALAEGYWDLEAVLRWSRRF